jgi:hypothetical protein
MTVEETSIVEGLSPNPSSRYGDYAHLVIDPVDDVTFWHNGEYFEGVDRKNRVGVFKLAPDFTNDVGVIGLMNPANATLSNSEEITVVIRNFGTASQSNFPVSYTVDGGETVTETFTGTVAGTSSVEFTFSTTANLGEVGNDYEITAQTYLQGDENDENDIFTATVKNLFPQLM